MLSEAMEALGPEAATELRRQAHAAEGQLVARSTPAFQDFTSLVASFHPTQGTRRLSR